MHPLLHHHQLMDLDLDCSFTGIFIVIDICFNGKVDIEDCKINLLLIVFTQQNN